MRSPDSLHAYRVVYDAGAHFPLEWVLLIPVAMFAIGLGVSIHLRRQNGASRSDGFRRGFMMIWTIGVGLLGIGLFIDTNNRFVYYRDSLSSGRVRVVEGVVSHFDPEPPEGHHYESFDVSDQHFSYSQYVLSGAFNHSRGAGGPIRDGLQVRIAYLDGQILRLEIADR